MIAYTITVIIATATITLALNAFWEYYKNQREIEKKWQRQETIALIETIVDNKLKEIITDEKY